MSRVGTGFASVFGSNSKKSNVTTTGGTQKVRTHCKLIICNISFNQLEDYLYEKGENIRQDDVGCPSLTDGSESESESESEEEEAARKVKKRRYNAYHVIHFISI